MDSQMSVQAKDADELADLLSRNPGDLPVLVEKDRRSVDRQLAIRILHQVVADIDQGVVVSSRVGRVQVRQIEFTGVDESGEWRRCG